MDPQFPLTVTCAPAAAKAGAAWDGDRWAAAGLAAVCLYQSVRRRGLAGVLFTVAAGALTGWAITNVDARRRYRDALKRVWHHEDSVDIVAEASEESFPASDAPPWTSSTASVRIQK